MPPYSIIFCGTPLFACSSLAALHKDPAFHVTHVVTQPDRPAGRGRKLTPPPVKELALSLRIPVLQPAHVNDVAWPSTPDFLVVVAYGALLTARSLRIPRIAPVNAHASLLPKFRGASPIEQCLLEGAGETGVTIQRMVARLDAGPILAQDRLAIDERETSVSLREKLSHLAAKLLSATLKVSLREIPQDENSATYCTKLTKADGIADRETMTAEEIDRRVRALQPWPGVTMSIFGIPVKILETALTPDAVSLEIPCKNGTNLFIRKLHVAGKRPITGEEWRRGYRKGNLEGKVSENPPPML